MWLVHYLAAMTDQPPGSTSAFQPHWILAIIKCLVKLVNLNHLFWWKIGSREESEAEDPQSLHVVHSQLVNLINNIYWVKVWKHSTLNLKLGLDIVDKTVKVDWICYTVSVVLEIYSRMLRKSSEFAWNKSWECSYPLVFFISFTALPSINRPKSSFPTNLWSRSTFAIELKYSTCWFSILL